MSHTDHPCCADADVFRRGAEHGEIEILPNPAQPSLQSARYNSSLFFHWPVISWQQPFQHVRIWNCLVKYSYLNISKFKPDKHCIYYVQSVSSVPSLFFPSIHSRIWKQRSCPVQPIPLALAVSVVDKALSFSYKLFQIVKFSCGKRVK